MQKDKGRTHIRQGHSSQKLAWPIQIASHKGLGGAQLAPSSGNREHRVTQTPSGYHCTLSEGQCAPRRGGGHHLPERPVRARARLRHAAEHDHGGHDRRYEIPALHKVIQQCTKQQQVRPPPPRWPSLLDMRANSLTSPTVHQRLIPPPPPPPLGGSHHHDSRQKTAARHESKRRPAAAETRRRRRRRRREGGGS